MALKIYIKARATPKVVAAFAERREFDKILIYSKQVCEVPQNSYTEFFGLFVRFIYVNFFTQVGYTPDYLFLLQTLLRTDAQVFSCLYSLSR